jgi:sortase (surface protein transpeptidase)
MDRLNALLEKSNQLAQFAKPTPGGIKKSESTDFRRHKEGKGGRKTEEQEDEELNKDQDEPVAHVRLLEQPSSVMGLMRYYQLEVE